MFEPLPHVAKATGYKCLVTQAVPSKTIMGSAATSKLCASSLASAAELADLNCRF